MVGGGGVGGAHAVYYIVGEGMQYTITLRAFMCSNFARSLLGMQSRLVISTTASRSEAFLRTSCTLVTPPSPKSEIKVLANSNKPEAEIRDSSDESTHTSS